VQTRTNATKLIFISFIAQ